MVFERSFAAGAVDDFKQRILDRLLMLAREAAVDTLIMPVGLFLVLDQANGGDDTASDIIKRFAFVDLESRNVIDFYFLGWRKSADSPRSLEFDLEAFHAHREALRAAGVKEFGGYADLLLLDAHLSQRRVSLDFTKAVHIDIAAAVSEKRITSAGGFLQGLIQAADEIRTGVGRGGDSHVFKISDRLGLAVARQSILSFVLDKWGKIIGAADLRMLAVRQIGPSVDLALL